MIFALILVAQTVAVALPTPEPSAAPPIAAAPPVRMSPDGFRVGIDTWDTVIAKLGKPQDVDDNSDGTRTATYSTTKTHIKGSTFIPYVGLFAGGVKSHSTFKKFTFDDTGVLRSYSQSANNADCNTSVGGYSCK